MTKKLTAFVCVMAVMTVLFSDVRFHSPDMNTRNEVLFHVRATFPGMREYSSLFMKRLDTSDIQQLTFFPESLQALSSGSVLQVRNRFGAIRMEVPNGTVLPVQGVPSFSSGWLPDSGSLSPCETSPDGRWLVRIDPETPAFGTLILVNTQTGVQVPIAKTIERSDIPLVWAPDSSLFIYSVEGMLYFARPEQLFSNTVIDASWRVIGPGSIQNIRWYSASRLMYISGRDVYRLQSSELLSRSLYNPLLGSGELAGKLPAPFNPSFDRFVPSPDGRSVMFAHENRNVYYCILDGDDYVSKQKFTQLPWLLLSGNTAETIPVWTSEGSPVVFTRAVEDGKQTIRAWALVSSNGTSAFRSLFLPVGIEDIYPSPDGQSVAFTSSRGVSVYATDSWKQIASYTEEPVVSFAWGRRDEAFIGGVHTIRKWNISDGRTSVIQLSSVSQSSWSQSGTEVVAESGNVRFRYEGGGKWVSDPDLRMRIPIQVNDRWRLYLDTGKGVFSNMLYVRSAIQPGGTFPIVIEPEPVYDALVSESGSDINAAVFSHGPRSRAREVALVFDAMDSLEGLADVLHVLAKRQVRVTFFINGEFIRRHPAAVNEIAKAGHQCASLFFTTWDLSGNRYKIDESFIARGLSRNEDEFYTATGQELSLLWHAPYYVNSPVITRSGAKAGYRYISPDVSVLDWVTREKAREVPSLYRSGAQLVEDILAAKKPGSIIPIRIGRPEGTRDDYLFEKVDLLLNALYESGYRVVTVDSLIQASQ